MMRQIMQSTNSTFDCLCIIWSCGAFDKCSNDVWIIHNCMSACFFLRQLVSHYSGLFYCGLINTNTHVLQDGFHHNKHEQIFARGKSFIFCNIFLSAMIEEFHRGCRNSPTDLKFYEGGGAFCMKAISHLDKRELWEFPSLFPFKILYKTWYQNARELSFFKYKDLLLYVGKVDFSVTSACWPPVPGVICRTLSTFRPHCCNLANYFNSFAAYRWPATNEADKISILKTKTHFPIVWTISNRVKRSISWVKDFVINSLHTYRVRISKQLDKLWDRSCCDISIILQRQ